MVLFDDDDPGYLDWLKHHRDGFVLNTDRNPRPDLLQLHRATCETINVLPTNARRWTLSYVKRCGDRAELESWAKAEVGGSVRPHPTCM
jgi:hypothetical protein